jgi:hypothetical protein
MQKEPNKKALQIISKGLIPVIASGVEPETVALEKRCSIQLSYATITNCFALQICEKPII